MACWHPAPLRATATAYGRDADLGGAPRAAKAPASPARRPPAWDDPPVELVPDWAALAQPSLAYVFDQQVQG